MAKIPFISIIIPARNAQQTLDPCLQAALASNHASFEVIVVDDGSSDNTAQIANNYTVKLISLPEHQGASAARNAGAEAAVGEVLFFIDADCVMAPDTLNKVEYAFKDNPSSVTGGTYTALPHDGGFFGTFQSIFIHYNETKTDKPDYIATHAMIISRKIFIDSGGFNEEFMPILEDVEFSHRLRKKGVHLITAPEVQVGHIFNFNLARSITNAYRKSRYWVRYSMKNNDLLTDSGTASRGLKAMAVATIFSNLILITALVTHSLLALIILPLPLIFGLVFNAGIIEAFFRLGGPAFGLLAVPYYTLIYPLVAAAGGVHGMIEGPYA